MIGELAVALKLLDTAFVAVSTSMSKAKEVESMASEVGRFFSAKKKVEIELEKARKTNPKDLLEGSALEEAIKIQEAEDRLEAMMTKLSKFYQKQGATHKWIAIKRNAAFIEAKRKKEIAARKARAAKTDKENQLLIEDLAKLILGLVGTVIVIAGIVFLIFGSGAE